MSEGGAPALKPRRTLRRGWPVLLAVAAVGLAGTLTAGLVDRRDLAFANGVPITLVAAVLPAGAEACQRNVYVLEPFGAVEVTPRRIRGATPPLAVELREARSGRRVAFGEAPGGYP